jgi:hypothetical protein
MIMTTMTNTRTRTTPAKLITAVDVMALARVATMVAPAQLVKVQGK